MFRLTHVSTGNLRGLFFPAPIKLRPINILVGKNSGGKSTFARIFPLFRQSVQARRRSPVLWYGDLVDFGSFDDACNLKAPGGPVSFNFELQYDEAAASISGLRLADPRKLRISRDVSVSASIDLKTSESGTYLSGTTISLGGYKLEMEFSRFGFVQRLTCGSHSWTKSSVMDAIVADSSLFPAPTFLVRKKIEEDSSPSFEAIPPPFVNDIKRALRPIVHGNAKETSLLSIANRIPLGSPEQIYEALGLALKTSRLTHHLSAYNASSIEIRKLGEALLLYRMPGLLSAIDGALYDYFNGVRYLMPLRATAQRFYRQQELAVDEVDPSGANIANVLTSLDYRERKSLAKWSEEHLNFSVDTVLKGGHVSLCLKRAGDSAQTNLADVGFGFSQILPILVQLWLSANPKRGLRASRGGTTSIVIEQPELHLHPAFQARLADLFVAAGKFDGVPPAQLIVETHSAPLVNRFGELISEKKLSPEDIQVLLFEPGEDGSGSVVRATSYDDKGFLKDWPYGFFEPDFE